MRQGQEPSETHQPLSSLSLVADPMLHHPQLILDIAKAVSALSSKKVLDILAAAALSHQDVWSEIRGAHVQEVDGELTRQARIIEHLEARSRRDYKATHGVRGTFQSASTTQIRQRNQPGSVESAYGKDEYSDEDEVEDGEDEEEEEQEEEEEEEDHDDNDDDKPETDIFGFAANSDKVHYVLHTPYAGLRDSQQSMIIYEAAGRSRWKTRFCGSQSSAFFDQELS
ncbi:hypothetical protein E4T42_09740 [Aureobasidium subglaciale]|nr:hypothetical protein E4T42_09740 [Aureobasidium subglaciale]